MASRRYYRITDPAGFLALMDDRRTNISQLAAEFGVSRPTLYNWAAKIRETLKHEKTPTPDRAGATEVNPKDSPTQTDDTRTVSGAVLNR